MKTNRMSAALAASVVVLSMSGALAEPAPRSGNAVFDRAVTLVEENFYDPDRLDGFRKAVALTVGNLPDLAEAEPRVVGDAIDFVLASLAVSHTGRFVADQLDYYELVNVFRYGLRDDIRRLFPPRGAVTYDGIGIASAVIDDRRFITDIYDGGPADRAGLLAGDEILGVDGQPFAEVGSFRDRAGETAVLSVRRQEAGEAIDIGVEVERIAPGEMFVAAITGSAEVIAHNGSAIGYLRLWAYTERQVESAIEQALAGPLAEADALVLDLRSRWGGAPADAADTFVGGAPGMTMVFRNGEPDLVHVRWRKPMVAVIDEGTRSGMEILAYALKANGVPLIGVPTAADVLAGRAYLLPDDSLLELAVADVFVDGIRLEDAGVRPDIEVPFDIRYAGGADLQLAVALDEMSRILDGGRVN